MSGLVAPPAMLVFTFMLGGGIDEEFGWRGFALPRLPARLPIWAANLLLGLLWSLWQLPLWWYPAVAQYELSFPLYIVSTTGFSSVLGWLYNASSGLGAADTETARMSPGRGADLTPLRADPDCALDRHGDSARVDDHNKLSGQARSGWSLGR